MTIALIDREAPKAVSPTERLRNWFNSYKMTEPTEGVQLGKLPYLRKHLTAEAVQDRARTGITDATEGVVSEVVADTYKIRFLFGSDVLHVDGLQEVDEENVKADIDRRAASTEQRIKHSNAGLDEAAAVAELESHVALES